MWENTSISERMLRKPKYFLIFIFFEGALLNSFNSGVYACTWRIIHASCTAHKEESNPPPSTGTLVPANDEPINVWQRRSWGLHRQVRPLQCSWSSKYAQDWHILPLCQCRRSSAESLRSPREAAPVAAGCRLIRPLFTSWVDTDRYVYMLQCSRKPLRWNSRRRLYLGTVGRLGLGEGAGGVASVTCQWKSAFFVPLQFRQFRRWTEESFGTVSRYQPPPATICQTGKWSSAQRSGIGPALAPRLFRSWTLLVMAAKWGFWSISADLTRSHWFDIELKQQSRSFCELCPQSRRIKYRRSRANAA